MIKKIRGRTVWWVDSSEFQSLIAPYNGKILIDVGTGDGVFVWKHARTHPNQFCIGIDSNRSNLYKISEKIYRQVSKGGAPNALFIEASVEALPAELDGLAEVIQIQFPWGKLLHGVATGDSHILSNLNRICQNNAFMKVIISLDPIRDCTELKRLEIPAFDLDHVKKVLAVKYKNAGFDIVEAKVMSAQEYLALNSSWAKRIRQNKERLLIYFLARAKK